ncbi:hypothetical protein LCGC14_2486510, partial [marine sediment metagenome]
MHQFPEVAGSGRHSGPVGIRSAGEGVFARGG